MKDQEIRELTEEVTASGADEPFGAYVFDTRDPGAELGRHLERMVFLEAFGNTADDLEREYGPYEASSFFIVIVDHLRQLPAGVLRVIRPSAVGLKSFNDLESVWGEHAETLMQRAGLNFGMEKIWDVATLAVPPDYRARATGGLVTTGLYQTVTLGARANGVELLVAILDLPVFRMLRWKLNMIFAGYPGVEPKPYLGSAASVPTWCDLVAADKYTAGVNPALHRVLALGIGLEAAMRPADLTPITRRSIRTDVATAG